MVKNWRMITVLLLCMVLAGSISCNPFGGEEEVTEELVEVVRGDLTVTVSGSGNIEVSDEMKLAFGVAGRVDKIYIEEGDEVSKGDVLAELETNTLELALTRAQVARTQAEVAVTQAQVALQTAEYNLQHTQDLYTVSDIKIAEADVDEAERQLDEALSELSDTEPGSESEELWQRAVIHAQLMLKAAKARLEAMLSGTDTAEVAIASLQVEVAQQSLELAKQSLELANQSLVQAQKQLSEATITAPFDGVIAMVGVNEKDTVSSAITIVYLIDPGSMELKVQVDEIDVTEVKPGQRVIIELDALPTLLLEGEVSSISLLPAMEAGVIVYDVKIDFDVPEGVELRTGMSATADVVIAERENILLVPDRAIKQNSDGDTVVEVSMVGGENEERAVVIGISDGFQTEIISGLNEGEVVVERRTTSQSSGLGLFGQ